jgi:hypothetical protein
LERLESLEAFLTLRRRYACMCIHTSFTTAGFTTALLLALLLAETFLTPRRRYACKRIHTSCTTTGFTTALLKVYY